MIYVSRVKFGRSTVLQITVYFICINGTKRPLILINGALQQNLRRPERVINGTEYKILPPEIIIHARAAAINSND